MQTCAALAEDTGYQTELSQPPTIGMFLDITNLARVSARTRKAVEREIELLIDVY